MIRRPLFFVALAFSAAVMLCFYTGKAAAATLIPLILLFLLIGRRTEEGGRRHRFILLILISYVISLMNYCVYEQRGGYFEPYLEQGVSVSGIVVSRQDKISSDGSAYTQLTLDADEIDGEATDSNKRSRILASVYGSDKWDGDEGGEELSASEFLPGDRVLLRGSIEEADGRRNPGCFDYRLYLKSIGIEAIIKTEEAELIEAGETVRGRIYATKESFLDKLEDESDEDTAGMLRGILFGEKSGIDEETLEEFQRNGTAHVLAVSGLHVGLVYGFIAALWRGRKGKMFAGTVFCLLVAYSFLASFSPSVVRAVFMISLHLFAKVTNRRYDLASAAFLVYILMLFNNPMQLFHAGFQMSFLAVLTISSVMSLMRRFYSGVFAASAAVQVGLFPYTMYAFNYISLISVLVNVPVIALAGVLVPLGLCSFAAALWLPACFSLLAEATGGLCEILRSLNSITCIEGVTSFDVTSPAPGWMAFYYMLLLLLTSEEGRLLIMRKKKRILAGLIVFIVALSLLFGAVTRTGFEDASIVFVDVGQGDCMHLRTEDGRNYLIDGGGKEDYNIGKKILRPYLLKNGVRKLDGAFVTHMHTDHYKGVAELCREGMVEKLFVYEGNRIREDSLIRDTGLEREDIVYLYGGQSVILGKKAKVEVLWPERRSQHEYEGLQESDDENAVSLILRAEVDGMSMLATGDIDKECEALLVKEYGQSLASDIIKAPHHGSKYSSSGVFAEAVSPEYAVFQVGNNNYGHPTQEAISAYEDEGAAIYRNDMHGAIGFCSSAGKSCYSRQPVLCCCSSTM